MRDQSFLFSKDIYGGQSKSVLCRFQQACFLPEKRFCAKGSCRHSFAARPFRLHPPGCLLVVRNILIYAFRVSAFCLPSACEIRVSGAQKISTVARVKACYVACSKDVFAHRKCFHAEGSCRLSFSQPVRFGYILLGAFWSFSFSTIFFFNIFATSNWID